MENKHSKYKVLKLIFHSCLWIELFIWLNPAYSQVETKVEQQEQVEDSIVQYITPMEYAFMMHEATSWLVKVSSILDNPYKGGSGFRLGIEKRIAPSFTLELAAELSRSYIQNQPWYSMESALRFSLESRWYYRLNKHIQHDRVARSMSDNYLALGLEYAYFYNLHNYNMEDSPKNYLTLFAKWGIQRRFLKHGYANFGVKAGIIKAINKPFATSFVFDTYVNLGLVFTKDKYKLDHEKLCPVFKCYEGYNFIIKSNLGSLIGLSSNADNIRFHFSPQIAFERKIACSSFSVNTEAHGIFRYEVSTKTTTNNEPYRFHEYLLTTTLLVEGRWYYNLKRRMVKGKTGNGLSADYIAFGGSDSYDFRSSYALNEQNPKIFLVTGWQRIFGKHLYYDIQVGFEHTFLRYTTSSYLTARARFDVGYRF
ncbi:MAG: hypothetical protein Q8O72_13115 [Bacteroidales bacterium]|nr:hypothetical protein [Bacteroidales bacterium]